MEPIWHEPVLLSTHLDYIFLDIESQLLENRRELSRQEMMHFKCTFKSHPLLAFDGHCETGQRAGLAHLPFNRQFWHFLDVCPEQRIYERIDFVCKDNIVVRHGVAHAGVEV